MLRYAHWALAGIVPFACKAATSTMVVSKACSGMAVVLLPVVVPDRQWKVNCALYPLAEALRRKMAGFKVVPAGRPSAGSGFVRGSIGARMVHCVLVKERSPKVALRLRSNIFINARKPLVSSYRKCAESRSAARGPASMLIPPKAPASPACCTSDRTESRVVCRGPSEMFFRRLFPLDS